MIVYYLLSKVSLQAILSQFSKVDAEDDHALEREIFEMEGGEVGDEEPKIEDNSNKLTPDVAASDASAVGDIISEAELSDQLSSLSTSDVCLGRISIAKVL
jgi:hypothetical protein